MKVYDFAGIGVGPFNLGLAALAEPIENLNGIFFDQRPGFDWHPGMMLESATLQTPFLSDLVTLADPTHPLSVLNYLKQQGRIYSFYIRENFFLMRREYNQYCQWVARQLKSLRFNSRVEALRFDPQQGVYVLRVRDLRSGDVQQARARKLVLGTGPSPSVPACCENLNARLVLHSSDYLKRKRELQKAASVTVVGSGQSAAEIVHDLLQEIDLNNYRLHWVTRSPRFYPLEYTKLTLEMTSPEYVDYFHQLPPSRRDELNVQQRSLYKGINQDLINSIYELLYVKRLAGPVNVQLLTNATLTQAVARKGEVRLHFHNHEQGRDFSLDTQAVVLATGYRYQPPPFIDGIADRIRWDEQGRFDVRRNYSIDLRGNEIFVQNAELHTHGFVTPDLGMACYRNASLIREMTGVEHYPIEQRIAFQEFGAPTGEESAERIAS